MSDAVEAWSRKLVRIRLHRGQATARVAITIAAASPEGYANQRRVVAVAGAFNCMIVSS